MSNIYTLGRLLNGIKHVEMSADLGETDPQINSHSMRILQGFSCHFPLGIHYMFCTKTVIIFPRNMSSKVQNHFFYILMFEAFLFPCWEAGVERWQRRGRWRMTSRKTNSWSASEPPGLQRGPVWNQHWQTGPGKTLDLEWNDVYFINIK